VNEGENKKKKIFTVAELNNVATPELNQNGDSEPTTDDSDNNEDIDDES